MLSTPLVPFWSHFTDFTFHSKPSSKGLATLHYWMPSANKPLITILNFCEPQWYVFVMYFSNLCKYPRSPLFPVKSGKLFLKEEETWNLGLCNSISQIL